MNSPAAIVESTGKRSPLPRAGDIVFGCEIEEKIGQGGFGSVYLARQLGLANRQVVLKLTVGVSEEPERLASLQHAHVVPVFSVGSHGPYQVLCMPFYGRQTLADVLEHIEQTQTFPISGGSFLSTRTHGRDTFSPQTNSKSKVDVDLPERPQPAREILAQLSFPESVVWVFARLAEGLAHAHENGIFHLDLKPQNVLMTNSGVPMILDFGQAHDMKAGKAASVGGTVRYMPPEQILGFANGNFVPDRRMDLYALGVMLFELLTGRHPYPNTLASGLALRMVASGRLAHPPRLRQWNFAVTPAVEAIVWKLLQPCPARRYQSADELVDDLNRQQQNRPLRYAGNPSIIERVKKFRRRHPAAAICMIAAAFGLSAVGAAGAAVQQAREKAGIEAGVQAASIHATLPTLRVDLVSPESRRKRDTALRQAESLFAHYGALGDPQWKEQPAVTRLPAREREQLTDAFGELALLCALAERMNAISKSGPEQSPFHDRAIQWNRTAEQCFEGRPLPVAVREQRRFLAEITANMDLARELADQPTAEEGSLDLYIRALTLLSLSKTADAIATLEKLTEREPGHAAGQFVLGICYHGAGRYMDASERYQLAKVLSPKDPRPCQNRGLLMLVLNRPKEAVAEFTVALSREPGYAPAHFHRALANVRLGHLDRAHDDLATSIKGKEVSFRSLLLQAQLYERGKNETAAKTSRAAANVIGPHDEADYVASGLDRGYRQDFTGALRDYIHATELNPRYLPGYQNQAHILGERLNEPEKALTALEKMVELSPEYAPAHAARAVMFGRIGKRTEAHAAIAKALAVSEDPKILYQAACVYSLTANDKHADDRTMAMSHLRHALRVGYTDFATLNTDTDVDGIRKLPEFAAAIKSAQELRRK